MAELEILNLIAFVLLFIGWVVAGLCALLAQRRNRSPAWWFATGLVFGLFALPVLALLPRRPEGSVPEPPPGEPQVSPYAGHWAVVTYSLLGIILLSGIVRTW